MAQAYDNSGTTVPNPVYMDIKDYMYANLLK